jgi:predicted permease
MSWFTRLVRRRALERELDKELQFHLDSAADDFERLGLSRAEGRRRARVELGGVEQVKESARDARGTRWIEDWWTDTRYALRAMARSPGFSAAAALTLAIGVGANTSVWSILDALMRRTLPVARPEQLYAITKQGIDDGTNLVSHPLMLRFQQALPDSQRLAGMASVARLYATIGDRPEAVIAQLVSGSFFPMLGVRAMAGRLISPDDDRTLGGGPVAVITESFWARQFGRDPSVVGRTVRVNGVPLTVIGVAQSGFRGLTVGQTVDLFVPLVMQHELRYLSNFGASNADPGQPWLPQNGVSWLTLVVRVDPAQARDVAARLDVPFRADLEASLADRDSASRASGLRQHVTLEPISRGFSPLRQEFGDPLRALMASVGLILLIACANLAGLLLARSAARSHEMAVRASLGAQPGRLVRQALTESVTLAIVGGLLGLGVAYLVTQALLRLASTGTRAIPLDASLDARVLAFAFGLTIVAGLLFGLAPALHVARTDLHDSFKSGTRVVSATQSHRLPLGRLLVMAQIALSLVLVTSAGVFVRTFRNLLSIDPGFERERLVTAQLDLRAAGYTPEQLPALYDRLLSAIRAAPGVQSASLSGHALASASRRVSGFQVPGRELPPGGRPAQEDLVTPDYFRTVGIRLLSGRTFTDRDVRDAPHVAVISQTAARRLFGTDTVVGRHFGYDSPPDLEVVGVVRDVRVNALREEPGSLVFFPLAQRPQEYITSVEARTTGAPGPVIAGLRTALASVDPDLPVRDVMVVEELLERGLTTERLVARLAGSFGTLALLLAAVGLYGVISYSVARRTNEMGVRLALGASPAAVSWVVLRDSLRTIVAGLVAGFVFWFPLLGLTQRLVYGLSPHDPMALATGAVLLLGVGVVAALLPAIRAARIDPMEAIRAE